MGSGRAIREVETRECLVVSFNSFLEMHYPCLSFFMKVIGMIHQTKTSSQRFKDLPSFVFGTIEDESR